MKLTRAKKILALVLLLAAAGAVAAFVMTREEPASAVWVQPHPSRCNLIISSSRRLH